MECSEEARLKLALSDNLNQPFPGQLLHIPALQVFAVVVFGFGATNTESRSLSFSPSLFFFWSGKQRSQIDLFPPPINSIFSK